MRQIDAIMSLAEKGWHPYGGRVDAEVYEKLGCPAPLFAKWMYEGQRAKEAVCVGCERQCRVDCCTGFSPSPFRVRSLYQGAYFTLSPSEMIRRYPLLRVGQAAYCLNISERQIYAMIADGRLSRLKDDPVRVPSSEVAELMEDFE